MTSSVNQIIRNAWVNDNGEDKSVDHREKKGSNTKNRPSQGCSNFFLNA